MSLETIVWLAWHLDIDSLCKCRRQVPVRWLSVYFTFKNSITNKTKQKKIFSLIIARPTKISLLVEQKKIKKWNIIQIRLILKHVRKKCIMQINHTMKMEITFFHCCGTIYLSWYIVPTFLHKPAFIFVSVCVSANYHSTLMTEPFHSGRKGLPVHSLTVLRRVEWVNGRVCVCVRVRLPLRFKTKLRKAKTDALVPQFFQGVFKLDKKKTASFVKQTVKLF